MTEIFPLDGRWPILGQKLAILAECFEILTSNLFCPSFTLEIMGKPILKSIGLNLATKMAVSVSQNAFIPKCPSVKGV